MKSEGGIKKALGVVGNVLSCLVLSALLIIAIGVLIETIKRETISTERLLLHRNLLIGFIVFFALFLIPCVRSNVRWLMKFTHEFTHLLFAILPFRGFSWISPRRLSLLLYTDYLFLLAK